MVFWLLLRPLLSTQGWFVLAAHGEVEQGAPCPSSKTRVTSPWLPRECAGTAAASSLPVAADGQVATESSFCMLSRLDFFLSVPFPPRICCERSTRLPAGPA